MLAFLLTAFIIGVVGGIMALGAFGIFLFGSWVFAGEDNPEKDQKKYETKLDKKFSGKPSVTWTVALDPERVPNKDQLITDAAARGYQVDRIPTKAKYAHTIVFKKQDVNLGDRVAPYLDK